jgi:hypothetical protein
MGVNVMRAFRISIAATGLLLSFTIPAYARKCEEACASACESSTSEERAKTPPRATRAVCLSWRRLGVLQTRAGKKQGAGGELHRQKRN